MAIAKTRAKVPTFKIICDDCGNLLSEGIETHHKAQGKGVRFAVIRHRPRLHRVHLCERCNPGLKELDGGQHAERE